MLSAPSGMMAGEGAGGRPAGGCAGRGDSAGLLAVRRVRGMLRFIVGFRHGTFFMARPPAGVNRSGTSRCWRIGDSGAIRAFVVYGRSLVPVAIGAEPVKEMGRVNVRGLSPDDRSLAGGAGHQSRVFHVVFVPGADWAAATNRSSRSGSIPVLIPGRRSVAQPPVGPGQPDHDPLFAGPAVCRGRGGRPVPDPGPVSGRGPE